MAEVVIDEIRFDVNISWDLIFTHEYRTKVTELLGGSESRKSYWSKGRMHWTIRKEMLSRTDIVYLESFFRGRRGQLRGFRLKHFNSYFKVDEPLPLLTNTTAQLQFKYNDPINPEIQIVRKPVLPENVSNLQGSRNYNPDITLKRNGVAFPSSSGWSIDRSTGIITFSASQASQTITWSGSYDWPVRFATDVASFHREALDIHDWTDIELLELKQ